jgi:hypothetical protein
MTTRTDTSESPLIEGRDDLLSIFSGGEKPRENWRIGTEHEKFVYRCADHRAPSWEEPGGIRDLLLGLTEFGWKPVEEGGKIIALSGHMPRPRKPRPSRSPTALHCSRWRPASLQVSCRSRSGAPESSN